MKNIVCISDLQVPYHDVEATKAVAKFIQWYQPETVVSCGDEMDMQTISKWSKGTELEFERSIGRDRDLTRQVLYDLTVEHMVRSNHTDRLFTTVAMRAPGLLGLPELQLENFLGLDELEIKYHKDPYELAPGWLLMHGDEGILLIVGTRFAATDLYREIRNPKHWSNGKSPFTYFSMPAVLETAEDPKDWVTLWAKTDQKSGTKKEPDADGLYSKWDGPALYRRRGEVTPTTWALVYQQQDVMEDSIFRPVLVQGSVNGARKAGPLRFGAVGHPPKSDFYTIMGIDPAMSGKTAAVMMAFDRRTQVRHILDVYNMEDPNPQKIRALMEDWVNKYSPNELRVEINAHQKAYALDEELNQWLASRGIQFRSHFTGKNKWDIDFGVASMAALFGTERDGKYQDDALIELPSSEGNEHVKSLINQLITWAPGVKKTQATDCVMALWFCEIRVKELIQQMGFAQSHNYNKYATRAGIRQRGVVNLDELAAATYADLYQ